MFEPTPLLIWGVLALLGTPALIPFSIGAWAYNEFAPPSRAWAGLLFSALCAIAVSVTLVWLAVREVVELGAGFAIAVVLFGLALGIFGGWLWRQLRWLGLLLTVVLIGTYMCAAGFLGIVWWLAANWGY